MKDERKTKDGRLTRIQIEIKTRPYPKYSRRRGEKRNKRAQLAQGFRDEVAMGAKLLAQGSTFNDPVEIICVFYLAKGDVFDNANLMKNVEDGLVDSGIIVDDNCTRVRRNISTVYSYRMYSGNPRTHIIISIWHLPREINQ